MKTPTGSFDSTYQKENPWRGSRNNNVMLSLLNSIDAPEKYWDTKHRSKSMQQSNQTCCTSNVNSSGTIIASSL